MSTWLACLTCCHVFQAGEFTCPTHPDPDELWVYADGWHIAEQWALQRQNPQKTPCACATCLPGFLAYEETGDPFDAIGAAPYAPRALLSDLCDALKAQACACDLVSQETRDNRGDVMRLLGMVEHVTQTFMGMWQTARGVWRYDYDG